MNTVSYTTLLFTIITLLTSFNGAAQNGIYDVRFNMNKVDCAISRTFIDVDVRAHTILNTFNLTDQNFRFSFNRDAVVIGSAEIAEEKLSGFVAPGSFYDPHTLTGSMDTIISYNVVLAGGTGQFIDTSWITVGTISFEILDPNKCLNLKWHDHAPENFPPTFIGEKVGNSLYVAQEGNYYNTSVCPGPNCNTPLPVELVSFKGNDKECTVTLEWITETETNNEYFHVEKSLDGREFEVIGTVKGSGTTLTTKYYTFVDNTTSATAYYRLKQMDFDGTTTLSNAIIIRSACYDENNANAITDLYPNPVVNGDVKVKFYATEAQTATLMVTDMLGRVVLETPTVLTEGANTLSFPSEDLTSGTYLVKISYGTWSTIAQKVVKLR